MNPEKYKSNFLPWVLSSLALGGILLLLIEDPIKKYTEPPMHSESCRSFTSLRDLEKQLLEMHDREISIYEKEYSDLDGDGDKDLTVFARYGSKSFSVIYENRIPQKNIPSESKS